MSRSSSSRQIAVLRGRRFLKFYSFEGSGKRLRQTIINRYVECVMLTWATQKAKTNDKRAAIKFRSNMQQETAGSTRRRCHANYP